MKRELDAYYLHEGTASEAYRYLGAHLVCEEGSYRYTFRVLAPHADRVSLVSDFTDWGEGLLMERETEGGVFSVTVKSEHPLSGASYKFRIKRGDATYLRADPYAFASRGGSDGASLLMDPFSYSWEDGDYMRARKRLGHAGILSSAINIFEVHLASFARKEDGGYLSYAELAEALLAYAKYMGYTHVELLPIAEYPYDPSWGYQVCAYYAPTSRFGTPEDFCRFVDRLHAGGLGVILDWVPAHFPKDEWGLYRFDGAPLYEYGIPWRQESRSWGTVYFDLGRREVRSFLISNAIFWLREYHIDGLRVDAVASMLYLDYDRSEGEWEENDEGENISHEAEEFLRALSLTKEREVPDALLIAEESTAYAGVTGDAGKGGLGFSLKWNMGFSNDFFAYLSSSPEGRRRGHSALNFPITYAYRERYILPISHDEVVYGKGSLFGKLSEDPSRRFAAFRTALLFFMTFPGKKHLFMGSELASPYEWDYDHALPWGLLENAQHEEIREYVAALNRFYLSSPPLFDLDFCEEGFTWLLPDESERALVAFVRRDRAGDELLVFISFSEQYERGVRVTLPRSGMYTTVFSTEGPCEDKFYTRGAENVLICDLPPASGLVLRRKKDILIL